MQFVKPITFAEAQDALGSRHPVTSTLNSAQWRDVPVALRQRAQFSSEVENVRFLQRAQDFFGDFLSGAREPNGALKAGGRAQFVKELSKFAEAEGMGPLDPRDRGTIKDITSQRRLELIFDTQVQQAQDYGYWKQGQDPDILEAFPAQRFIRVRDVTKPRKYHEAALGEVRLKSDLDFWLSLNPDFDVPWGPWGFGSGCDVEDVDREEAEALGLISEDATAQPVEREFNEALEASTRGLKPAMLAHLEDTFGSQIVIDGDRVRWVATEVNTAGKHLPPAPAVPKPPVGQYKTQPEMATAWESKHASAGSEHGVIMSLDGTVLEANIHSKPATPLQLKPTAEQAKMATDAVFSHNHPSGASFSEADVLWAMDNNVAEMRVVSRSYEGTARLYRLIRPAAGWNLTAGQVQAVLRNDALKLAAASRAKAWSKTRNGAKAKAAAAQTSHEQIKQLAESAGWGYEMHQL